MIFEKSLNKTIFQQQMPSKTDLPDHIYISLMLINRLASYYCLFAHFVYLLLLLARRELRKRTLLFINHAVLASLFYPLAMLTLQQIHIPSLPDRKLSHLLCSAFEIFWPFGIYIRMYSILLIAIHRYMAVFHLKLFKRINDSHILLASPILLAWTLSIMLPLIAKSLFNTTYSNVYCLDGYSTNRISSAFYSVFYVVFSLVLPAISIISIYVSISLRLRRIGNRLNERNSAVGGKTVVLVDGKHVRTMLFLRPTVRARELRFANQYILMCLIVILTICFISVFSLKGFIPNFFSVFYYWRPVIRTCILMLASMIPTLSFYFSPTRRRLIKLILDKFF